MKPLHGLIALVLIALAVAIFYVAVGGGDTAPAPGPAEGEAVAASGDSASAAVPDVSQPAEAESRAAAVAESLPVPGTAGDPAAAKKAPRFRVFGRVIDEGGSPLEGAGVTLAPGFGRWFRDEAEDKDGAKKTDRDGRFLFEEVAAEGGLTLRVRPERHADLTRDIPETLAADLDLGNLVVELGGSLAGHVLDENGNPVGGAQVKAWRREAAQSPGAGILIFGDLAGANARTAKTDASGFYRIDGLKPGEHMALASAEGFTSESVKDIQIKKGGLTPDVTITVSSGGAIEGVVVDAGGRPIEGARVAVSDTVIDLSEPGISGQIGRDREVSSDANGWFRLKGLKDSSYHVAASKQGFLSDYLKAVAPGTPDLRLTLRVSGVLYGVVRDQSSGEPVADFEASVRRSRFDFGVGPIPWIGDEARALRGREAAEAAGVAEEPGLFALCDLPSAEVTLKVSAEGFTDYEYGPIQVDSGARVRTDVDLTPEIQISGIVLDAHGKPAPGASVVARRSEDQDLIQGGDRVVRRSTRRIGGGSTAPSLTLGDDHYSATADEAGRFSIRGLAAGEYRLEATHPEWAPSDALPLSLAEGKRVEDLEVLLRAGGALTGTTYDADGNVLAGALVSLNKAPVPGEGLASRLRLGAGFGPDGDGSHQAESDESGRYTIQGILPGRYLASVRAPNRGGPMGGFMFAMAMEGAEESGVPVTIEEGETATADLHLAPAGAISGRVSEAGTPLAGVPMSLRKKSNEMLMPFPMATSTTDDDGEFTLQDIEPGKYTLSASPKGAARPIQREVEVRPRQTAREMITLPTGVISGRVKDVDSGRGIPGVVITVRPAGKEDGEGGEETTQRTMVAFATIGSGGGGISTMRFGSEDEFLTTDENGCYEARYLEPGDYRVEARGGGIEKMQKDLVRVHQGQRTDGVDFEATIGAVLTVRPRLGPGEELPDFFEVTLINEATKEEERRFEAGQPSLRFDGVSPGRYTVKLSAGERSGEMLVEVTSGEQKEVAVPLR